MGRIKSIMFMGVAAIAASFLVVGCSSDGAINETVATVNGTRITVMEVREAIGIPGGLVAASMVDTAQKKKAIDQLVETRILAAESRAMGLDNTNDFKEILRSGEGGIAIKGLFRKELDARSKKLESEIDAAAKDLAARDKNLKPADARFQAGQSVFDKKLGEIQREVTDAARKAFPDKIESAVVKKIAAGEKLPDDTVVGSVGSDKLTYGEAKVLVEKAMKGMKHPGKDFTTDEQTLGSVIGQDLGSRSLLAYAKQQGGDKGKWRDLDRSLLENSILIGLLAERVIFKSVSVTDKEIESTYAEHKESFTKGGKLLPLADVRGQIANFIENDKKRKAIEAFLVPLKAKAKVAVVESMLSKI